MGGCLSKNDCMKSAGSLIPPSKDILVELDRALRTVKRLKTLLKLALAVERDQPTTAMMAVDQNGDLEAEMTARIEED